MPRYKNINMPKQNKKISNQWKALMYDWNCFLPNERIFEKEMWKRIGGISAI